MLVLDHISFGTSDRTSATEAVEALGFTPSAPSRCEWEISGAQHAADAICVVFDRQYLDFVQIPDPRWLAHLASSSLYGRGSAPTGVVLSGLEPEQLTTGLATGSSTPAAPYPITRRVDHDPPFDVRYRFLPLEGLPFGLISDESPRALRQPAWLSHPNGAIGVAAVDLRVPSQDVVTARLAEEPLALHEARDAEGAEFELGGSRVRFHEAPREGFLAGVSQLLPRLDIPSMLAIEFHVASIERAEQALLGTGVAFTSRDSRLEVDAEQGFGTGIVFRERGAAG